MTLTSELLFNIVLLNKLPSIYSNQLKLVYAWLVLIWIIFGFLDI